MPSLVDYIKGFKGLGQGTGTLLYCKNSAGYFGKVYAVVQKFSCSKHLSIFLPYRNRIYCSLF